MIFFMCMFLWCDVLCASARSFTQKEQDALRRDPYHHSMLGLGKEVQQAVREEQVRRGTSSSQTSESVSPVSSSK